MITYPLINPNVIHIGSFYVRWYGVMYLLGFVASILLVKYQIKKCNLSIKNNDVNDLFFYLILGVFVGGRIGYVIFYNLSYYIHNPLDIIAVWNGGMSFHGGLIGTVIAGLCFCLKRRYRFWLLADLLIVTVPIGLGLGRIGNFINGELYGRPTALPWGMIFPNSGSVPRHPSQLYEFFLEGIILFCILWYLRNKVKVEGAVFCLFLIFYGIFRFVLEFFREPDVQLGFVLGFMTMGQVLSLVLIVAGIYFYWMRRLSTKTICKGTNHERT